ncbi:peptidase S8/S53 domain-containing protein [Lactarius quietus]|nr:peptidase S8/S53 domain-containing protein [Lactarius quietus]
MLLRFRYGSHLSKEQVAELVAPHDDTLEFVHSWLKHHGVPSSSISRTHGGGWLTITSVPISQANELLCASYQIYKRTGTNKAETILRTVSYSLPAALLGHVETVAPTTLFATPLAPPLQTPRKRSGEEAALMANSTLEDGEGGRVLSGRDEPDITPQGLRSLYNTEAYAPVVWDRNAIGTLGLHNDYPREDDLQQFMAMYRKDAKGATFIVVPVNGGEYDPTQPADTEGSLDIQYASVISYPTLQFFYNTGGVLKWTNGRPDPRDPYLAWLKYLLDQPVIPPTITISYGNAEPLFPWSYATVVCNLFAQLGLRGVSVLVASGDQAVGRGDCLDSFGNVRFTTLFPASCPWVTTVGGTMDIPEVAWPSSSGGFSQYFPRPNYQDRAVLTFLQNLGNKHAGLYNARGRGVPDIAAQADQLVTIVNAVKLSEAARAPQRQCLRDNDQIVAGIVALLNDYLISTGRSPLGFLNLRLYSQARAGLNDITSGNNAGCGTDGFTAAAGWDPVTGLGTPDFLRLQQIFNNLIIV